MSMNCWPVGSCILLPKQLHRFEKMEDIEVHGNIFYHTMFDYVSLRKGEANRGVQVRALHMHAWRKTQLGILLRTLRNCESI